MDILLTIIISLITGGTINILLNRFFDKRDKKDSFKIAARLIMKDRIKYLCTLYKQQKWLYEDELEDLEEMHKCYHSLLNGNGYLDNYMERINELEIRDREVS